MWQELFELAYRYLRGRGATHADAEDLAQETLVSTFEHLDGIDAGRLRAWVCVVARNKHIDAIRQRQSRQECSECVDPIDSVGDPLREVLRSDDRAAVTRLLESLPPDDQRLLQLKYVDERTVPEIATELGRSVNTVKVGLFRARKRARGEARRGGLS